MKALMLITLCLFTSVSFAQNGADCIERCEGLGILENKKVVIEMKEIEDCMHANCVMRDVYVKGVYQNKAKIIFLKSTKRLSMQDYACQSARVLKLKIDDLTSSQPVTGLFLCQDTPIFVDHH